VSGSIIDICVSRKDQREPSPGVSGDLKVLTGSASPRGRPSPHNGLMAEALIVLQPSIAAASREALARLAPATQSISDRVFLTTAAEAVLDRLRGMDGVADVLTGPAPTTHLPDMDEAEALFVRAWLSTRGIAKMRRGEGLAWDTPPMLPPDRKE
jgi:hypothetical protein